ncbi:hypothetical protein [Sporosarcina sp. FSL K6-3457]|uniref:hypothetical protein n=1 Tax=Sporosarcina sp. FSL K6-3457 TaxID=2978204 RepID=UPI0030F7AB1A
MKNLTLAIVLRILFFITLGLYAFNANNFPYSSLYFNIPFWTVLFLLYLQSKMQYKSQPDGRPLTKDLVLPEFASKDEREIELTGKAAKDALTAIFLSTPVFLFLASATIIFEGTLTLLLPFLLLVAIPIIGLITYYFSYRHHYLQ